MQQWVGDLGGRHLAIDGKVSRGAKDPATGKSTLHLLRAWVGEASLSVGYAACADKSNELEALPRLLASLQLRGTIVTIDAMAGHPKVAELLHEAGADYLLALKANEKHAFETIKAHFAAARPADPGPPWPAASWQQAETREMNRGRYEQRRIVVSFDLAWFDKSWKWPGLQSIIEVRRQTLRQRHNKEQPTEEYHYYLSSLPPDAVRLGELIRAHWSVENQCHRVLDVTYHEHHPDNLTQLGAALKFYGISLLYAPTPQAKGKVERLHQLWQGRLPPLLEADDIVGVVPANVLLESLRQHRNTHEKHRELDCTPQQA